MTDDPQHAQIADARDRCLALWEQASIILQDARAKNDTFFDVSRHIPGLQESVSEFDASMRIALDLFKSIDTADKAALLPRKYITDYHNSLQQLAEALQQIISNWQDLEANGGLQNIDMESLSAQSANGNVNVNIGKLLIRARSRLDSALEHYYRVALITRDKSHNNFSDAFLTLQKLVSKVRNTEQELKKTRNLSESTTRRVEQLLESSHRAKGILEELTNEARSLLQDTKHALEQAGNDASRTLQEIKSLLEQSRAERQQIATVTDDVSKLKSSVEMYQSNFDKFDAQLKVREADIKKGHEEQGKILEWLSDQREVISAINEQSEAMLAGATTAGLAGKFGEIADKLAKQVRWAQWAFVGSIFVLAMAAIPLILFIVELDPAYTIQFRQAEDIISRAMQGNGVIEALQGKPVLQIITEALIRAVLLLPGVWLVKFCAARHAQLFRLKEHYAYKHSVAAAVDGFKKQADPYKDEIAAAAFFELTFNPAERMDAKVHEARLPNPIMEKVLKKVGVSWDGRGE